MENPRYISAHISLATFVRFLAITFILLILWILRDIIILIFLSMVLAATISREKPVITCRASMAVFRGG